MDSRMSDVISALGNQRPRNPAWRRGRGGGRRWNADGRGLAPLGAAAAARPLGEGGGGGGERGGWLWRLKSRRLAAEGCQCGVGAAGGRRGQRVRVPPAPGTAAPRRRSPLRGEEFGAAAFPSCFLVFLSRRRPRLSPWGASPRG